MNTKRVMTGVVWGLLALGAFHRMAYAQATPPVLKQTATVEKCEPPLICIGNSVHLHKELSYFTLKGNQQFTINRKFPFRRTRFIDVKDDLFGAFQRPDMLLINGDQSPMAVETFQVLDSKCESRPWSECVKIRDFPLAFGIHDLENDPASPGEKPTRTAHAFIYIPIRFSSDGLAGLGDTFLLLVLHIPDTELECEAKETRLEREHCKLTVRLNGAWQKHKHSQRRMRYLIASEYRRLLDHLLDESVGTFKVESLDRKIAPLLAAPEGSSFVFDPVILTKLVILLHNDIIHGTLK